MYMHAYIDIFPAYMSIAPFVYVASRGQKKSLDPMELELQMFVNHRVGAGN